MNLELAACLAKLARPDESIRYYVAVRHFTPSRCTIWPRTGGEGRNRRCDCLVPKMAVQQPE